VTFSTYAWKLYRDSQEGRVAIGRDVAAHVAAIPFMRDAHPFEYDSWMIPMENGETIDESAQYEATVINLHETIRDTLAEEHVHSTEDAEALFTSIVEEARPSPLKNTKRFAK
jgi:hypothetical protein